MNGLLEVLKVVGAGGWGPAVVILLVMLWVQGQRFDAMEQRAKQDRELMEQRLDGMEERFHGRFDDMGRRLDAIERRQMRIEEHMRANTAEIARLHGLMAGLHPELGMPELPLTDARAP